MKRDKSGTLRPDERTQADDARAEHADDLEVDAAAYRSARGRAGGYARVASQTDEQLSEGGRRAVNARWDRERARRAAEGLPPLRPTRQTLTEEEMAHWLAVVDERFPDREFDNRMQRRRLAERLAREAAARLVEEALRSAGKAGA